MKEKLVNELSNILEAEKDLEFKSYIDCVIKILNEFDEDDEVFNDVTDVGKIAIGMIKIMKDDLIGYEELQYEKSWVKLLPEMLDASVRFEIISHLIDDAKKCN